MVEVVLTVLTSGTIVCASRRSIRVNTRYLKISECDRSNWANLLAELYTMTLPRVSRV